MDTVLLDIFYNQPVSQVKVSQIVEETEISRGAFYKYFLFFQKIDEGDLKVLKQNNSHEINVLVN